MANMQVYTGVPLLDNNTDSNNRSFEGGKTSRQSCPSSIVFIHQEDIDEEEAALAKSSHGEDTEAYYSTKDCELNDRSGNKYVSFTFPWWRIIVAIMVSINTLATDYLVQDEISGYMVAGDYHTLLEMIALFYIIQCPGAIVLYFLCNHREDFQFGCCDFFNFFVLLATVLQNWVCLTMIYYIYFL